MRWEEIYLWVAGAQEESVTVKVLLITGSYPPMACGVGDYSYNLGKALAALPEIGVSVLTSIGGATNRDSTDSIQVFPIMERWGIAEAIRVIKIIWQTSPDIVHIQYPTQGYKSGRLPWLIPIIAFLMRKKIVQTWHEIYGGRLNPFTLVKAIVPGALVVVRPQYIEQVNPKLRKLLRNKRIAFIRNGSAIPKIALSEQEAIKVRQRYIKQQERLVVFFGFVYPHKGTELLFDIADPELDQIVIAGQFGGEGEYYQNLKKRAFTDPWAGKTTVTGRLPSEEVAALLTVADAVVLPFRAGGGEWNTSIHCAVLQGTFVLTTATCSSGFDTKSNVYYSEIDNIQEMKAALNKYAGTRRAYDSEIDENEWSQIAAEHYSLYEALLAN